MSLTSPKRILITGASGLIGRLVAAALRESGIEAVALGRSAVNAPPFSASFIWNPATGYFDDKALEGVDAIIHLAGAGIADKRWTDKRKQEILESRIASAHLLAAKLKSIPNQVRTIVAASAIGYYGNSGEQEINETSQAGNDFLALTCMQWEQALNELKQSNRRLAILRIGIVLDANGGALPVMARPVKMLAGAPYGNGKQFVSWIDSHDLVQLFLKAVMDENMSGIYNAVAPAPVSNKQFVHAIGKTIHRPVWPIPIPGFIFKIILGEQAEMILGGQYVSSEKVINTGFPFKYPELLQSLQHQLG